MARAGHTEEQRAQRERLRAMVDALRDGRPIPVSEPAQQAVEAGSSVNKGRLTFVAAGRGGRSSVVDVRLV